MEMTYYYSTNGDGTTYGGFRPFMDGDTAYAPDWNPDPECECGGGLHVVTGHPLYALAFVTRTNPIFCEVVVIDSNPERGGKIRCRGLTRLREIDQQTDPLFDQAVLIGIAESDRHWDVRIAAVNRITDPAALLRIAETDRDRDVRIAATERIEITNQAALLRIAETDSRWIVRIAAVNCIVKT